MALSPGARQFGQKQGIAAALLQRGEQTSPALARAQGIALTSSASSGGERYLRSTVAAFRQRADHPFAPGIVVDFVGARRSDKKQAVRRFAGSMRKT